MKIFFSILFFYLIHSFNVFADFKITNYKDYKYSDLKPYLMNDKKVAKGKLNLILLKSVGAAFKTDKFKQINLSKAFKL